MITVTVIRAHRFTGFREGWRQVASVSAPSLARYRGELVEMHVAVRFRPETDLSRNGFRPGVVQVQLAVEIALDLGAGDANLEVMPLACRGRCVADPLD